MNANTLSGWLELDEETDHWARWNSAHEPIAWLERDETGWIVWSVVGVDPVDLSRVVRVSGKHYWLAPAKLRVDAVAEEFGWQLGATEER